MLCTREEPAKILVPSSVAEIQMPAKRGLSQSLIASTVVVVPAVAAAIGCVWRPDILAPLTLIPAWCWLPAGIVSIVTCWRLARRKTAVALSWLWIGFAFVYVEELPSILRLAQRPVVDRGAGVQQLRVVSMNCANSSQCLQDLQRVKPDLVLLQEAPGEDQLREIARGLFGEKGGALAGGDTAILARGTLTPGFVDRRAGFVTGRVSFAEGVELECASVRLSPPVSRLDFWTADFWREHRNLRNRHRRELRQFLERLREHRSPRPLVVGGDFNMTPLDPALDTLKPLLVDAFPRNGRGWGATGTNDWPLFRVDQIWTESRLSIGGVRAEKTVSSDHRMVIGEISVRDR